MALSQPTINVAGGGAAGEAPWWVACVSREEAFGQLYARRADVRRVLRKRLGHALGDREDAEDALQEVYLRVWRALDPRRVPRILPFHAPGPYHWLLNVARHYGLDAAEVRRHRRVRVTGSGWGGPPVLGGGLPPADEVAGGLGDQDAVLAGRADTAPGPAELAEYGDALAGWLSRIGALPAEAQRGLLLAVGAELGGYSQRAAAEAAGLTLQQLKSSVYWARRELLALDASAVVGLVTPVGAPPAGVIEEVTYGRRHKRTPTGV